MSRTRQPDNAGLGSDLLDRLAELIGEEAALRLSVHFGGLQAYIPTAANLPGSEVGLAVGDAAARTLAKHYGGNFLMIPLGRRAHIIKLAKQGEKKHEIASIVGCTERYVYKVLAEFRRAGGAIEPSPKRKPARRRRRKKRPRLHRKQPPVLAIQRSLFDQEEAKWWGTRPE